MTDLDRHLLLCDPVPGPAARTKSWRKAVQGVSQIILNPQFSSPWEMAEILVRVVVERRLGSDNFGTRAGSLIAKVLSDSSGHQGLLGCACAMSAAIHVLKNRRLSADYSVSRRDSIAVALWSALSFQRPLAEPRLEDMRAEILKSARRTGLEFARQNRIRRARTPNVSLVEQNREYQWNAALDHEEIEVLRWVLADESTVLKRPYSDVERHESVALGRGFDLGLLLTRLPVFEHYELASRDVAGTREMDLGGLIDAVGEDRGALVSPFDGNTLIESFPATFPLVNALRVGPARHADDTVTRSLTDWCGRALLESSVFRHLQTSGKGS